MKLGLSIGYSGANLDLPVERILHAEKKFNPTCNTPRTWNPGISMQRDLSLLHVY